MSRPRSKVFFRHDSFDGAFQPFYKLLFDYVPKLCLDSLLFEVLSYPLKHLSKLLVRSVIVRESLLVEPAYLFLP